MAINPFAFTLASTTLNSQKVGFELRFNLLQNALINRHNEKIEELSTTSTTVLRGIEDLTKRQNKLVSSLPVLADFRQGNTNNKGQLEKLFDEVTALFQTFNQDATVDADEVAAFEEKRDYVADRIENLWVFTHSDINDGQVIQRLKDDVAAIRGLEVTEGALLDDENVDVADTLTALQTEVSVAITVVQNTISTTLDMEQRLQAKFADVDAQLLDLTSEEQQRRENEIADAEADLGNFLRSLSLSFEINSGLSQALANRLKPFTPPPGSVLSIFS